MLLPYAYDVEALKTLLQEMLQAQLPVAAWQWLQEKSAAVNQSGNSAFAVAFAAMPRKTGKAVVTLSEEQEQKLAAARKGLSIQGWTLDRLARVWLLLQLDATDQQAYVARIEQLFPAAEMNELVALYSALPVLAYPEAWRGRCAEGIRNNIGTVLEAVITNNPYPAEQLAEGAWNQLVMKGFFTEKRMDQVVDFDKRANPELAQILLDFAHERWAAGRAVPPLLWRGVAPFVNEKNFADLERAFFSENSLDRDAAALACAQSSYAPARALLEKHPEQKDAVASGVITWTSIAEKAALNA
ncbi:hypothetical protein BUE76_06570 [Cnuella takakiae]|nr:hypothetical protein BUE76_06570 [Cnuella takakiae]